MEYQLSYLERPGLHFDEATLQNLVDELQAVAATCFDELPIYQALTGKREELSRNVLTLARRRDGSLAGFCSGIILEVPGFEHVLHTGLTCVHANDRRTGLTRRLNALMARTYLLRHVAPFGHMWVTTCACVLSSLGNVALYFDDVFPSPFSRLEASDEHLAIARAIAASYREQIYIDTRATFDFDSFVFRGAVRDTMFEKSKDDVRFRHRLPELNDYYASIMRFEHGDEVLQIAKASLWTGFKASLGIGQFRELGLKLKSWRGQEATTAA